MAVSKLHASAAAKMRNCFCLVLVLIPAGAMRRTGVGHRDGQCAAVAM